LKLKSEAVWHVKVLLVRLDRQFPEHKVLRSGW
jgi:hypothetical protein